MLYGRNGAGGKLTAFNILWETSCVSRYCSASATCRSYAMFSELDVSFEKMVTHPCVNFAFNSRDAIPFADQCPNTPVDVRRHVWSDHAHLVPVLATPITTRMMSQTFKLYGVTVRKREPYGALPNHHLTK